MRRCYGHRCADPTCDTLIHRNALPVDGDGACVAAGELCEECAPLTACVWCGSRHPEPTVRVEGDPYHLACWEEETRRRRPTAGAA